MQVSSIEPPRKVKNILIRHSCSKEVKLTSSFQRPEKPLFLKYFPKYYKNLTLQITNQNPLLSKIKRIKRLETFSGHHFKSDLQRRLFRILLGNHRKTLKEVPQMTCEQLWTFRKRFYRRLALWKIKLFPNLTKFIVPRKKTDYAMKDSDDFLVLQKSLMNKYLGNMRKLKALEIYLKDDGAEKAIWMLEKLNRMEKFLEGLEILKIEIDKDRVKFQEIVEKKCLISHLTGLRFSSQNVKFDPSFMKIPEACKKLRFLSMSFGLDFNDDPGFQSFLKGLQSLPRLTSIDFSWPGTGKNFWTYFKPHSFLRFFKLKFDVSKLIQSKTENLEDLLSQWEEMNEMEEIELTLLCSDVKALLFIGVLITMMLRKVRKLCSFKCFVLADVSVEGASLTFEPFFIGQVPHLYESLQKFEFGFQNMTSGNNIELDLKNMKVFKNLREIKLDGRRIVYQNIEEIADLLEEQQYPLLEFKRFAPDWSKDWPSGWFRETMEKLSKGRNLKVVLDLSFEIPLMIGGELKYLADLCDAIVSARMGTRLFVRLTFRNLYGSCPFSYDTFVKSAREYGEIRNLAIDISYKGREMKFLKVDREKEQRSFTRW